MTMRECKLAILAIAVLLQVHTGAGYLSAEITQDPQTQPNTLQETLRGSVTGTRMVGRNASPQFPGGKRLCE